MLAVSGRAHAALDGRAFVIPDDIKAVAPHVLRHRLPLSAGAEIEGISTETIVSQVIEQVAAPR
jgi:MoxR-like ATPase